MLIPFGHMEEDPSVFSVKAVAVFGDNLSPPVTEYEVGVEKEGFEFDRVGAWLQIPQSVSVSPDRGALIMPLQHRGLHERTRVLDCAVPHRPDPENGKAILVPVCNEGQK